MKIHHLSCGCMCPMGGRLFDGVSPTLGPATLVCHCLLVETNDGLTLVDTGFGLGDVAHPRQRIPAFFRLLNRPKLKEELTARRQIEALGFKAGDVRHILLTHLDFDHAGGIGDFPNAKVHVFRDEYEQAQKPGGFIQNRRFRPQQWGAHQTWNRYSVNGETWFGFEAVRNLEGLPPEILMVPLVGHTLGHCGIAVKEDNGGWLLLAGDAYFHHEEMRAIPHPPKGAKLYERMMDSDRKKRLWNQLRLRHLIGTHQGEVTVACSHDATEFERLRARSTHPAQELLRPEIRHERIA